MLTVLMIAAVILLSLVAVAVAAGMVRSMGDGDVIGAWIGWSALEAVGKVLGCVLLALLGQDS